MPLPGSVVEQMMLDFVSFIAYKKVKIKFKKAKCVSNRCNDLFQQKKYFGFRCTLKKTVLPKTFPDKKNRANLFLVFDFEIFQLPTKLLGLLFTKILWASQVFLNFLHL